MSGKGVDSEKYVGFDKLPSQVHRRAVRAGFEFTLMVVGETGLGKSTFVNSLFLRELMEKRPDKDFEEIKKTVEIETLSHEIMENHVKLKLTVVDTPGYGDRINNETAWKPVLEFVEEQYKAYLDEEKKISRRKIPDTRVHVCLYFIAPTGPAHGMKELDVLFMKKLHGRVNIVPVVAKADAMTKAELAEFKKVIRDEIEHHEIKIYEFPLEEDDKEEFNAEWPFAVVGSINGADTEKGAVREYPWGVCEVENDGHSDFPVLRSLLIEEFMQDLKEVTHEILYENFRAEELGETGEGAGDAESMDLLKEREKRFQKEIKTNEDKLAAREAELKDREELLQNLISKYKQKQGAGEEKKEAASSPAAASPRKKKSKR